MADETIHDQDLVTSAASNDEVGLWVVAGGVLKRITVANLVGATLTGLGTIVTQGYTLTVPATGTAALLNVAQTYTALSTFSGGATFNGGLISIDTLMRLNSENVNIVGGAITFTRSNLLLTAEGGVPDDLTTINGGSSGQILLLHGAGGIAITVKHAVGNIRLNNKIDFVLSGAYDMLLLVYWNGNWCEIGRGDTI